jgi:hypothetical protein
MSAPRQASLTLSQGMTLSGMTFEQLWLRLLGIGGDTGSLEVEAYVLGLLAADRSTHDSIAQAINEHFLDRNMGQPVRYADDIE